MARQSILVLPRSELEVGYDLTWRFKLPPGETENCTLLRAILKVYAWNFRQRSAGSVGAGATHDHGPGTLAGPVPADAVTVISTSAQPTITMTSGVSAAVALATDQLPAHGHGAVVAEDVAPNANLDITIDEVSYKTGLGDGTEKKLIEEDIAEKIKEPGEHTIVFSMSSSRGAVEALLEIEW